MAVRTATLQQMLDNYLPNQRQLNRNTLKTAQKEYEDFTSFIWQQHSAIDTYQEENSRLHRLNGTQSRIKPKTEFKKQEYILEVLYEFVAKQKFPSKGLLAKAQNEFAYMTSHCTHLTETRKKLKKENKEMNPQGMPQNVQVHRPATAHGHRDNTHLLDQLKNDNEILTHDKIELQMRLAAYEDKYGKIRSADLERVRRQGGKVVKDTQHPNIDQEYVKLIQKEVKRYQSEVAQNAALQGQLNELRNRFSAVAMDKLTRGNPAIADLSDVNRPTKLAEQFGELYDNDWTNAFEEIQNGYSTDAKSSQNSKPPEDKIIIELLLNTFIESYQFCQSLTEGQILEVERLMIRPVNRWMYSDNDRQQVDVKIPQTFVPFFDDFKNQAVTLRKCIAADKDVINFVYDAFQKSRASKPEIGSGRCFLGYEKKCVMLAWLMCVQDPPMYIHYDLRPGDDMQLDKFKHYTNSGKVVDFLVWPALCLERPREGAMQLVAKGVAQPIKNVR
ncbi:hypothetical protein ScPMuIL_010251 [Solemya velum]